MVLFLGPTSITHASATTMALRAMAERVDNQVERVHNPEESFDAYRDRV
jgi:hypothetical protein